MLIPKHERRFTGFDDKIIAMYARGMTVREIQGFLLESYGVEVVARVHQLGHRRGAWPRSTAWQARPLEPMYPVVFFDALRVKIREDAVVRNKAIYLALGVLPDGTRDILGLWIEDTEGAKFWMKVFNDLKTRGVARHPDRRHRRPQGHGRGARRGVPGHHAADLHRAPDPQQPGLRELEGPQAAGRGDQADLHGRRAPRPPRPSSTPSSTARGARSSRPWRPPGAAPGTNVIPFFAFPPAVRRVIYTTNAIESVNAQLRKIIKTRGHFPSDDAATKLIWLALRNITADWGRAAHGLEGGNEPIRDPLRGSLHEGCRVICGTDLPTASVVRRKRRPPPWTSLRAPHTKTRQPRSSVARRPTAATSPPPR